MAARRLAEIAAAIAAPRRTPHKGSLPDDIVPRLRAIPRVAERSALSWWTAQVARETLQRVIWSNNLRRRIAGGHRLPQEAQNAFADRKNVPEEAD